MQDVYAKRGIALAIPAVNMGNHKSWIFKTRHLDRLYGRDDKYKLADVCMATSAAPLYRSLTALDVPDSNPPVYNVFADGGLWANNPVLVALIDAMHMAAPG